MLDLVVNIIKFKGKLPDDGLDSDNGSPRPEKMKSKGPPYSRFTQQELPACKPILTPGLVIASFAIFSAFFIPIGFASLFASQSVVEIIEQYDKDCVPDTYKGRQVEFIQTNTVDKTCNRKLTVPKLMKSPVFVYYELDNFNQNHRRYVRSRSDEQLKSKASEAVVTNCKPEESVDGKPIVPCGLVAWSLFNDTYKFSMRNAALTVNKKDIAWKSDKDHKFGSDVYPKNFQSDKSLIGGATLDPNTPLSEQEDLMVWMRTAALPTFRKLYGRIEVDLKPNEVIEVEIKNNYNSYGYGGTKKLVLSTTTWIGGKNNFLGFAYLAVGAMCLCLAAFFIFIYIFKPRATGDPAYLSWNRK